MLNAYSAVKVQSFAGALFGSQVGSITMAAVSSDIAKVGENKAFNQYFTAYLGDRTAQQIADLVVTNLNITAGKAEAVAYVVGALGGKSKAVWGETISGILEAFSGMTAHAVYGQAATDWNGMVNTAVIYTGAGDRAINTAYALTNNIDVFTANVFNSAPVYTPGGNDFINSLQDEDVLTGRGVNPTLNVTLGSVNDAAEGTIVPTLKGIETVKIQSTGSTGGINFQDATGLKTVSVDRITQNNASLSLTDMNATATTYNLNNATRAGTVTFASKEEVLTGSNGNNTQETLAVNVNNSRASALTLSEGTDGGADAGYYFETVNMTTTGNNDLDAVTVSANGMEDTLLGLAAGTTTQTLNIVANGTTVTGSLEINNLTASGVETMTIAANARVDIAANKMVALAAGNDGISTADLETVTITGAANVMIDGLDTAKLATKTLTVNAAAMTGDLKLGVATASDASSSGTYATRTDKDLSVTSGSGNDQIVTYTTLAGDITTNAGNDVVRVGNATTAAASLDVEGVSTITTGEGNDTVVTKDLLVTANDKDQATNSNFDDVTAANIDTGAGNDSVTVGSLTSASDWDNITITDSNVNDQQFVRGAAIITGAGTDSVSFTTIAEGASITTGDNADTVTVSLVASNATILAGDTDADVVSVVTATNGDSGSAYTDEVSTIGVADRLGAVVDTGSGDDTITFTDASSLDVDATTAVDVDASNTIVARDALLAGGAGADTLSISTLDAVTVTTDTSMSDQDTTLTGTQTDINANVTGVETLNLTVLNQIISSGVTNTAATVATSGNTTTVTFNARYDLGDVVAVTVGGETYSYTVSNADGTTGADVATKISALITADAGSPAGGDADYASKSVSGAVLSIVQDGESTDGDAALTTTSAVTNATNTPFGTGNDNNDSDGAYTANVLRFDADLTAINLTSQEQILETGPATEVYVAGTATAFTLKNMREGIALTLTAHEATGVNGSNALADDTLLSIASSGAVTTNSSAKDVTLTVNWDNSGESNDSASVNIGAATGALSGTFDVLFDIAGGASTDTTDDTVATADTSDKLENFTINVTDNLAHSFDMGSFADFGTATTSLTVNTGGASVAVDAVSVDRIAFNNAAGSAVTAANVTLRVNAGNNYNITTGSGTDIIDLRADNVQSDDGVANTTAADTINGGAGRDIMIVTGADSLGNNNLAVGSIATQIDDDVFENINAVETILIDTATASTSQDITLNEAAKDLGGVDTLRWVGTGTQTTNIVIGNDFGVVAGTGNGAFGDSAATGLVIDASAHTGATTLVIESKADDADQDVVNLDIRLSASGGADLTLVDAGVLSERVELSITTTATTNIVGYVTSGTAAANGRVKIVNTDTTTAIDKITMYEGTSATETENSTRDTVTIEADWTNDAGTFEFDASRLGNTDVATDTTGATGGMTFTVESGDLADIIVRGGANNDSITTLAENDTIYGGGGADTILGAAGADVINGEAGADLIGSTSTTTSESGNDTIDAGTGADTVYLAAGNDSISLGVDSDADNLIAYGTSNAEVAALSNSQASDTVTNFTSGTDKVTIHLFANGTAGGDVINASLFAVAADLAAGDNTLTGTAGAKVQGDGFYSTATSQLLIDLDGDGDITTNDLSVGISGAVAASDLSFVITGSANADTISGGSGADTITIGLGTNTINHLTGASGAATAALADTITDFTAATAVIEIGTYTGDATANTGNYVEVADATYASYAAVLTALNTAAATLAGTSSASLLVVFAADDTGSDTGYVGIDRGGDGTVDEVIILTGIVASGISVSDFS